MLAEILPPNRAEIARMAENVYLQTVSTVFPNIVQDRIFTRLHVKNGLIIIIIM